MSYLIGSQLPVEPAGRRFRDSVDSPGILALPGAHNGLAALQARDAGFKAVYLSGAAVSASMGLPDLGILTIDDMCFFIRQVARASGLPVLVDGDTGYGEALNVMHMVRSFEDAGAGAVHIEDQVLPKKCGHLNDKRLVSCEEMTRKVAAAARARRHLYVIARTDAVASEGIDAALERAKAYIAAGADAVFPEALTTAEMFRDFVQRLGTPILANMTEFGRTPHFTKDQFAEMGCKMVIWPVSALRMAARAQRELYATLTECGSAESLLPRMQTRVELYETIRYQEFEALDINIAAPIAP